MKQDAKIILRKIRDLDLSKLHFVDLDWFDNYVEDQEYVYQETMILKSERSIESRLLKIVELTEIFATYDANNKFQCRKDANRSAVDIWRIYNNYFRPVSIFTIMRTLYKIVVEGNAETLYCNDIKKQVFFPGSSTEFENTVIVNELGVRFAEWRTIGL